MYYPVMLDLKDRRVLIIGGGRVGLRKCKNLLETGAKISVISPDFLPDFRKLDVKLVEDYFKLSYLEGAYLVIAASSNHDVNRQIVTSCKEEGILVNSASSKEGSDFITPAIVDTDSLLFAISSKGSFPALSKYIRKDLERRYEKFDMEFVDILEEVRAITLEKHRHRMDEIFSQALEMDILQLREFYGELLNS